MAASSIISFLVFQAVEAVSVRCRVQGHGAVAVAAGRGWAVAAFAAVDLFHPVVSEPPAADLAVLAAVVVAVAVVAAAMFPDFEVDPAEQFWPVVEAFVPGPAGIAASGHRVGCEHRGGRGL